MSVFEKLALHEWRIRMINKKNVLIHEMVLYTLVSVKGYSMKKLVIIYITLFMGTAHSFSLKLGGTQFAATHPADHNKIGVALGMSFNEDKSHSLLIDAKVGFQTTDVVNPGAGNNPTAPDEKEDKSGANPILAHFLYQIKEQPLIGKISFGTTIYALDLGSPYANNFSESFTYKQEWSFKPLSFIAIKAGALLSLSITNTDQLPTLFAPEASISFLLGNLTELEAKYESLNMVFLGDGPEAFTQNIISLSFIFPNRF